MISEMTANKTSLPARNTSPAPLVLGNLLVLGVLIYAWALQAFDSDLYYRTVQEDEYLEWGTFWAFVLAGGVALWGALLQRRATGKLPWFLGGVGLFCIFVAGEEISWAQRVFSYRPPVYFLENNFQQELNVHNVISTDFRKLALKGVILGYGVVLAAAALVPAVRKQLERYAVAAPSAWLIPAFFASFWLYESYPWSFSGEIVELMLGFAFLFAALEINERFGAAPPPRASMIRVATAFILAMGLGLGTAMASRSIWTGRPEVLAAARTETEALKNDFLRRARTRCGVHKRVYSFVEKYDQDKLYDGQFASLTAQGLPEERAEFFLDPWNSPYWIRHKCSKSRGAVRKFVYSFGPNRRRDSSSWEIRGDDVGVMIQSSGEAPGDSDSD